MENQNNHQQIIEALLFASDSPLSSDKIQAVLKDITPEEIEKTIDSLNEKYQIYCDITSILYVFFTNCCSVSSEMQIAFFFSLPKNAKNTITTIQLTIINPFAILSIPFQVN